MSFTDAKWKMFNDYQEQYKLRSIWSIYSVENLDAFSGLSGTELVYSNHWGGETVRIPLKSGDLTWGELYHAADKLIRQSGDEHHVFIESLTVRKGPHGHYLELDTGS